MAGLTVKRDDVTGLAPTGDLDLTEKSSLRLDSLLLMFGPAEHFKQNRILPLRATSALKKQKTFDLILVPNDTPIFFFFPASRGHNSDLPQTGKMLLYS